MILYVLLIITEGNISYLLVMDLYFLGKNSNIILLYSIQILQLHFRRRKMRIQFYIANFPFCFNSFIMELHLVGSKNLSQTELMFILKIIHVA